VDDLAKPSGTLRTKFVGRSFSPRARATALRRRQAVGTFFAGELGDIESLEVSLESISCFLIPYHHSLDDASKGSYRTTLMFGNTVEI
jgi:hypothetical protein